MEKLIINTNNAPAPIGPVQPGRKSRQHAVFISGQMALNPETGQLVER